MVLAALELEPKVEALRERAADLSPDEFAAAVARAR